MNRTLFVTVLLIFQLVAVAQTASIRGTVVDQSKALIPGVTIQLEHLDRGEKLTTITDASGRFTFFGVSPGNVRVTASLPGFQSKTYTVNIGASGATLDFMLQVAGVNTQVEVSISTPSILTTSASSVGQATRSGTETRQRRAVGTGARRMNTESYDHIDENPLTRVSTEPRSTFAIDVDTASYSNVRRFINSGGIPPKDAVRIEELVNYFKYDYAAPTGPHPVAIHTEVAAALWEPRHRLVRIGIRARDVDLHARSRANLVFLVDVSGSMGEENKLPLVQRSLRLLVDQLRDDDTVSMVVYAGATGLAVPPTPGVRKREIHEAIDRLQSGGSTNGGAGIQLAYKLATENFVTGGINRVILATDGDFNVGITNQGDLVRLIQQQAKSGVFLTVLGFGIGNYKDSTLEKLADKGNGNYAYIDTFAEARRVFVDQLTGNLMTVAKDVKLQIEFNPAEVEAYRLIGYESRLLADADFNDDTKDGGDMGAAHNVTAFYEVVLKGTPFEGADAGSLKYQKRPQLERAPKGELLTVSLRYKQPHGSKSTLLEVPARNSTAAFDAASADFQFAASVAAFGMLLRDSANRGQTSIEDVLKVAEASAGEDPARSEFIELARKASLRLQSK
jgi:Ca-activated chloride channel family protein